MKADINVTPLIDVLLVLLIIFLLVAPVAPRALEASLPREPTEREPRPAGLVVDVRNEGLALNTAPILDLDDLDRRLRAAFRARSDQTLIVRVTGDVAYERVVATLDVAEGAGASRIGIVSRPSPAEP